MRNLIFFFLLVSFCAFSQKTPATLISENDATTYSAPFRIRNAFNDQILSNVNQRTPVFLDSADITKRIKFYFNGSHPTATQYNVTWPNKSGTVAFLDDISGWISKAGNGLIVISDSVAIDSTLLRTNIYGGYDYTGNLSNFNFQTRSSLDEWELGFNQQITSSQISPGTYNLNIGKSQDEIRIGEGIGGGDYDILVSPNSQNRIIIGSTSSSRPVDINNQLRLPYASSPTGKTRLLYVDDVGDVNQQAFINAEGDLIIGDPSGNPTTLNIGTVGQVLTSDGSTAYWETPSASGSGITYPYDSMQVLYGDSTWRVPSTPLITVSGTTLTLDNTYNGKIINATNASGLTITVPTGLANHFSCGVWRASGAGDVSLSASGTTLNGLGLTLSTEETALSLIQDGQTDEFIVVGAVGGSSISGTTGTTNGNVIVASGVEGTITSRSLNINSDGLVSAIKESAINNSIDIGLGIRKRTTGTAATGIGTGIQWQVENASGTDVIVAQESIISTGVTAGSESFDYSLTLRNAGSNAERLRVKSTGQLQLNNYTSSSSFSGTPVGYLQYDASGNVITAAVPSGGSSRPMTITLHSNATANITLTNQPNSEQFLNNSNRNIWLVDFTGYDSVKVSFRTITGSASANSPRIKLEYATTFGSATTDYSPIGTGATEVSAAISTTNALTNSGWVALTAAAKGEIYIALMQDGGDGAEDPAIASITVTVK